MLTVLNRDYRWSMPPSLFRTVSIRVNIPSLEFEILRPFEVVMGAGALEALDPQP